MRPETSAPTLTTVLALSVPVARTSISISPRGHGGGVWHLFRFGLGEIEPGAKTGTGENDENNNKADKAFHWSIGRGNDGLSLMDLA